MKNHRTPLAAATAALLTVAVAIGVAAPAGAADCPAPISIAHRGESKLLPEETTLAFVAAARAGAKYVEADVRWSRSGTAMLIHDATVDRTTNGTGYVTSLYTSQIQALDAGSYMDNDYASARVPTLGAGLRAVKPYSRAKMMVEPKTNLTDAQIDIVAKAIVDNGMTDRVVVQSFIGTVLTRFHKRHPTVPLALATSAAVSDPVAAVKAAGATIWKPAFGTFTAEQVDAAHAANIKVWPWTVDTVAGWEDMAGMCVDGLITNLDARYVGWALGRFGVTP